MKIINWVHIFLCLFIAPCCLFAQVSIGTDDPPEDFSVLQLNLSDGGLRLNQLTAQEKISLQNKIATSTYPERAVGLTIYDKESRTIQFWDGTNWQSIIGSGKTPSADQVLHYNAATGELEWITLKIPQVRQGDYYLKTSYVLRDSQGLIIGDLPPDYFIHKYDEIWDPRWLTIAGLTTDIHIPVVENVPSGMSRSRVSVQFQTGFQIATPILKEDVVVATQWNPWRTAIVTVSTIPSVSFSIGVFLKSTTDPDAKLKIARVGKIIAGDNVLAFSVDNIMGVIDDLAPGDYNVQVAVRRRSSINMEKITDDDKKRISIGCSLPESQLVNDFMLQSFFKVDVYLPDTSN